MFFVYNFRYFRYSASLNNRRAHLNDGRFLEMPYNHYCYYSVSVHQYHLSLSVCFSLVCLYLSGIHHLVSTNKNIAVLYIVSYFYSIVIDSPGRTIILFGASNFCASSLSSSSPVAGSL